MICIDQILLGKLKPVTLQPINRCGAKFTAENPKTEEEYLNRLGELLQVIRSDRRIFGYCATQLTDIYQEINGFFYFDRTPKFALEKICALQSPPAAYENENLNQ